jgi:hypothetical protein
VNPVRSIIAVLGATVILRLLGQSLELALVEATAEPTSLESYFQARNHPGVLAGVVLSQMVAALLAGYVAAKVAGVAEIAHAGFAALFQVVIFAYEFIRAGNPGMYPLWVQVALPLVTAVALLAGAAVRAKARLSIPVAQVPPSV